MNQLITATEVVALAFPDKNFLPGKILSSHITVAQEGFLRPAMGDDFYLHLINDSHSDAETDLVNNYLKPALAMYVRYIILPDVIAHMSNTGLQVVQPLGTMAASDRQAGTLRDQAKDNAAILMDFAVRFIERNPATFPLYLFSETVQATTRILGGVIMGGSGRRKISAPAVTVPQSGLADAMVNKIADLRTKTGYSNGSLLICNENNGIYQYDISSVTPDNGDNSIAPASQAAGRWIMIKEIEMVNL